MRIALYHNVTTSNVGDLFIKLNGGSQARCYDRFGGVLKSLTIGQWADGANEDVRTVLLYTAIVMTMFCCLSFVWCMICI